MNDKEFKDFLINFIERYELEEDDSFIGSYDKREFISFIMDYGKRFYGKNSRDWDLDEIFEKVKEELLNLEVDYASVRAQDSCIAIAFPCYVFDAKNEVGKTLGIIPDIFIEISGPMSTVLIIDCEKQFLRKTYLGIGEDEWLL